MRQLDVLLTSKSFHVLLFTARCSYECGGRFASRLTGIELLPDLSVGLERARDLLRHLGGLLAKGLFLEEGGGGGERAAGREGAEHGCG